MEFFSDRPEVTDRCPRRHLLDNPDLSDAITTYRAHGGVPDSGARALQEMTSPALDALYVIESATSYRREQEDRERKAALAQSATSGRR